MIQIQNLEDNGIQDHDESMASTAYFCYEVFLPLQFA